MIGTDLSAAVDEMISASLHFALKTPTHAILSFLHDSTTEKQITLFALLQRFHFELFAPRPTVSFVPRGVSRYLRRARGGTLSFVSQRFLQLNRIRTQSVSLTTDDRLCDFGILLAKHS